MFGPLGTNIVLAVLTNSKWVRHLIRLIGIEISNRCDESGPRLVSRYGDAG